MELHFRGLEVPSLGSPRDIVYRGYLLHQARLELKRHKLSLLTCLGAPGVIEEAVRKKWTDQANEVYSEYAYLLLGLEEGDKEDTKKVDDEARLLEYYEKVVKPSAPKLTRDGQGVLHVEGLPSL